MNRAFRTSLAHALLPALVALPFAAAAAPAQADGDPPISAVVDSAALVADLAALAVEPPQGVPPLFAVAFDSTGGVDAVTAMFDRIPAAYAGPVAAAIRARLKPQPPSRRPVRTWLRVVAGPQARVDRPRLVESQPRLTNRGEVARLLSQAAQRHADLLGMVPGTGYTVQVRFRVQPNGTAGPGSARVVRSSGNLAMDAEALAVVERMRFRPATLDRIPVGVWVELPVNFRIQAAQPTP